MCGMSGMRCGNGWLKPVGYPQRVWCWHRSANPTLHLYPPHLCGKTHGFAQTRELPYLLLYRDRAQSMAFGTRNLHRLSRLFSVTFGGSLPLSQPPHCSCASAASSATICWRQITACASPESLCSHVPAPLPPTCAPHPPASSPRRNARTCRTGPVQDA